ncbi:hypothetical protein A2662_00350 [Candidatus Giovannonibacteria bacterium RIFCSPHIGHO2_01_FULL_45_33]|uniref:Uncharacterized protein n=1 Tax=Candidatus Giovannonibacteria bacterium RIFCSPLOWO2_01_FULL_45_34 TaxID=1798351 RepID=A0A1F5WZ66_9BACT|nr:MAG: hypothetical protein A2662_00350 [Candidatus Giovannonibacteria bacterium RIFCSPHIGHO2_01_FULL_45_33]OGF70641.1 MAG: hypothetical protein A3C73_02050 [Candidatus Giovannonibacteria bacterium RIFCSPHIGHO2_02_FULL_44_11]OGF80601.1 MAG: hypothetical protein A2930_02870 [Candidatus Giovannonibacteria bacterium RIFCSPLOWO2_01_FULL_45_34]
MKPITNVTEEDVLGLPICDLIRTSLTEFMLLFRKDKLPSDEMMKALDHILCFRILYVLDRDNPDEIRSELDGLLRLVPHDRREELNSRESPWSARIEMFGDLLATVISIGDEDDIRTRAERLSNYRRLAKLRPITAG